MTDLNTGWLNILNIDMYIVLFALKKLITKQLRKLFFTAAVLLRYSRISCRSFSIARFSIRDTYEREIPIFSAITLWV